MDSCTESQNKRQSCTGTKNLVTGITQNKATVKTLISSKAVGYYGDRGDEDLTESSLPGDDFLADVCIAWEREADNAREQDIRVVTMRTGIVLGAGGGAASQNANSFQVALVARLATDGSGCHGYTLRI